MSTGLRSIVRIASVTILLCGFAPVTSKTTLSFSAGATRETWVCMTCSTIGEYHDFGAWDPCDSTDPFCFKCDADNPWGTEYGCHTNSLPGTCGGRHGQCAASLGGDRLASAIESQENPATLAALLHENTDAYTINRERGVLQLRGCNGGIAAQYRLTQVLSNAIQLADLQP
jgi:hypothetical protein